MSAPANSNNNSEDVDSPLGRLLSKHTVADVVTEGRQVIEGRTDEKPEVVFQRIVESHVLSVPIWDEESSSYVGSVDTRDLVQYVIFLFEEEQKAMAEKQKGKFLKPPAVEFRQIFDSAARMYPKAAEGITVKYLAVRNRFVKVMANDSLVVVADLLSRSDIHRVAVINPATQRIVDIISQSTIVAFINAHRDELAEDFGKKVDASGLATSPVVVVRESDSALDVFRMMAKHNLSGLAVVDGSGRLIGNTSGSDLKFVFSDFAKAFQALHSPIVDFLAMVRQAESHTHNRRLSEDRTRHPTISVKGSSQVEMVVGKLAATKVHRLFVADDEHGFKPEGVIAITDLLSFLLRKAKGTLKVTVTGSAQ